MVSTTASWVPPILPAHDTLSIWSSLAFGIIQGTDQSRFGIQLQNILNGMVMISGSNNVANLPLPSDYAYSQTYNCLETGTQIGLEVFVLLGTLVVVLLWLFGIDLYALVLYWKNPKHTRVKNIPLDYLEWQLEVVREVTSNSDLTTKDLGRFEFGWIEEKNALGIKESSSEIQDTGNPLRPVQSEAVTAGKR